MPTVQNEYKDRLFSFIFGSEEHKDWTLSLYNAVNGTRYDDPEQVTITTVESVLYLGMHNDVSFLIANEMNMYEQQSTYCPNMPLRMLQYSASLYEKYVTQQEKNKYGRALIKLPVPRLVVFYNGKDDKPEEQVLHLADAFEENKRALADIEVRVRMININTGNNAKLLDECKVLREYSDLVGSIRQDEKTYGSEMAIDRAIESLPADSILKPFLEAHKAEVKGMLLTEYNEAKQMELFREEGREEGIIEQAITTAKHMLARGKMTIEEISEDTQLPLEKVKELAVALKA